MCRIGGTISPEMTLLKFYKLPGPSVPLRRDDIRARMCTCLLRLSRSSAQAATGLLLLLAVVLGAQPEPAHAQTTATYTVTFEGNWNTDSTPGGVVGGAHFTTLIGAVHNSDVSFWAPGGTATAGVEGVAELGATGTFRLEITAAGANVKSTVQESGTGATGTGTFEVEFSRTHPLLTLLSMIGPSPDWFVGVSGLSMLDELDAWRSSYTVDLFPYDAGTEDGEEFSLNNTATSPRGTITRIRGQGKFTNTRMARLSFTLKTPPPPSPPMQEEKICAVSEVTDDRSFSRFVECAAENIEDSVTFEETLSLLDEFRNDEGDWNDGSTYFVLLTKGGGVYFHAHAPDREAEDRRWSGTVFCDEEGGDVLNLQAGDGCAIEGGGYAHSFSASHVPLTRAGDEFVLLGGFDETPEGEPFTEMIDGPSTEAGDVDTYRDLEEFVGEAVKALRETVGDPLIDPTQLRGSLRQRLWREGDVYVYIMDETGRVIFDGEDRSREQKLTDESGKHYVVDSIAEGEKEVVHTEGDFLIYAERVEEDSRVYIVGSGYRFAVEPEPGESGDSGGGGGCAVGGSGSGGTFGLSLIALVLLLAVKTLGARQDALK